MWSHRTRIEIEATPADIWKAFADVANWPRWNAGIAAIELHGPFATGSTFTMQPPGEPGFTSTLIDVAEERGFTDETIVGPNRVIVEHRIEALEPGRCRVVYATEVFGPDAEQIGPMVTGDFDEVLAGLKAGVEVGR
ncbi:MAG: SRPBCC family protein [Pelomonas sp.]|nr:SRPBCC family protein [Roseateles sp.]